MQVAICTHSNPELRREGSVKDLVTAIRLARGCIRSSDQLLGAVMRWYSKTRAAESHSCSQPEGCRVTCRTRQIASQQARIAVLEDELEQMRAGSTEAARFVYKVASQQARIAELEEELKQVQAERTEVAHSVYKMASQQARITELEDELKQVRAGSSEAARASDSKRCGAWGSLVLEFGMLCSLRVSGMVLQRTWRISVVNQQFNAVHRAVTAWRVNEPLMTLDRSFSLTYSHWAVSIGVIRYMESLERSSCLELIFAQCNVKTHDNQGETRPRMCHNRTPPE